MLGKFVAWVVSPLGTALLMLGLAVLMQAAATQRRRASAGGGTRARARTGLERASRWLTLAALVWLWLWSSAPVSDALRGWIEDQAGPRRLADVRAAEYGVVLGGSMSTPRPPLFEQVGLVVYPAPTDFEVVPEPFEPERWLPSTRSLDGSARAFKELLGRAVGR